MIEPLVSSPLFVGIMILLINIGSRYITHEFSNSDEEYSQNILLRRLAIFAVCFVGTRDLVVSILLTAGFVILASGFLRGKPLAREGMKNGENIGQVDSPAYDNDSPMFTLA